MSDSPSTLSLGSSDQVLKKYMILSMAVGLVPLPLVDVAALTGIQLQMLSKLAKSFDVEFSKELSKTVLGSLLASSGSVLATTTTSRFLLRFAPGGGAVVAGVNTAVFAGASTFAVGKVFVQHFESGGTFLTFDPEKVREYFASQYKQGTVEVGKSFAGIRP